MARKAVPAPAGAARRVTLSGRDAPAAPDVSDHPGAGGTSTGSRIRPPFRTVLAVLVLLAIHATLAERSLVQENPTVDEVVHLPAGVTYWQKRTFRLYHHNPPLIKMVAALPVVWANPVTEQAYQQPSWTSPDPSPTTFSQTFAHLNIDRYFELFQLARMVMPLFSIVGGPGRLRLVEPALRDRRAGS